MTSPDPLDRLFAPDTPLDPDPEFARRLRRRVELLERQHTRRRRRPTMSKVIPYLTVTDARAAIDFYREVFGAELVDGELFEMDDGRIGHASLKIGDADLYLSDEFAELNVLAPVTRGGSTAAVVIHVADADETYAHAVEAGATAERPVENQHGARSGWFADPWGHRWSPTSPAK